jgi:hypothetical protein
MEYVPHAAYTIVVMAPLWVVLDFGVGVTVEVRLHRFTLKKALKK